MGENGANEMVITERVGRVVWHLAEGDGVRVTDAVALTGMTPSGARKLLKRLSRVLPIYCDDRGFWQRCEFREIEV